eukprot:Opistho-2@91305
MASKCILAAAVCIVALCSLADAFIPIGHRGNPSGAPENTMPGFIQAHKFGARGVETDLRLTKDGVIVLMHDETVDRTTNGTGYVSELTYEYISSLDAGSWYHPSFANTRVPTFLELLLYARDANLTIIMDLKNETIVYGKEIAALALPLSVQHLLTASCWSDIQALDIQEHLNVSVVQALRNNFQPASSVDDYFKKGYRSFSLAYFLTLPALIRAAHERGMTVYGWTVDDKIVMKLLIWLGYDGLLSNNVPLLVEAWQEVQNEGM